MMSNDIITLSGRMFLYLKNVQEGAQNLSGFFDQQRHCHGLAFCEDEDGATYEGEWHQGRQHGHGVHQVPAICCYAGEFVDGVKKGFGILTDCDDPSYTGQWDGDLKNGFGCETMDNGDKFIGEFQAGRRVRGVFTYAEGGQVYFTSLGADGSEDATCAITGLTVLAYTTLTLTCGRSCRHRRLSGGHGL